ncbi:hypothetical protein FDI69_gp153 [Rhodococcus phage Trina]|uniref:Uncharacterized protein n=1 Tax=Rhodococcus phage Trina TaxID=2027905 RepID=A0A2D0ZWW0_9CAUD|nr:hypothetical protein FDI69_gp153 [Rhodococcus phage Trina]ASZ75033.1 hypothetical protein SEA_TRINA_254 [Rhodococcus phage Trina]
MSDIGNVVMVRKEAYKITDKRHVGDCGSKFFGKFKFTLVKVADGSVWNALGKSVAWNTKLYEAKG